MQEALADAAPVFERPDWLALASDAYAFVTTRMTDAGGRLSHSWRAGRRNQPAVVDDAPSTEAPPEEGSEADARSAYFTGGRTRPRAARRSSMS